MQIVRKATVSDDGEIFLKVPEFAGQTIDVILGNLPPEQRIQRPPFGIYQGKGWMADDFDDPLPEFEPYM